MKIKHLFLLLCVVLFYGSVVAQEPSEKATVYIYMTQQTRMMKRFAPPLFIDDKRVADLSSGRYVKVYLPPGTHTFHSTNKKKGGAELGLVKDETYYLRMNTEQTGFFLKYAGITTIPKEEAGFTIKQLKPAQASDIKNREIVDMSIAGN